MAGKFRSLARWFVWLLIIFLVGCGPPKPKFQAGEWHIQTTTKVLNARHNMMDYATTHCLSSSNYIPYSAGQPRGLNGCEASNIKVVANTVTWQTRCVTDKLIAHGNGEVVYDDDKLTGTFEVKVKGDKVDLHMIRSLTGQLVGECDK